MHNLLIRQYFLQDCAPLTILDWVPNLIVFIQIALFSALRVFAIWDRSYVWSLVVFALSIVPFATNIQNAAGSKYGFMVDPVVGIICTENAEISQNRLVYVTRGAVILADTIVLVLTWIKTFRSWKNARSLDIKVSITTCILRDGTIYFMALLAMNIAQMLTGNIVVGSSIVADFTTFLPSVLINRFMINLRQTSGSVMSDMNNQQQEQPIATLQFRGTTDHWLGNIGEELQDDRDDERDYEETDTTESIDEEGRGEIGVKAA
ncbi:uncharacterized protein PHACADRAFT_201106 [Phanerochaete carnosa HHB-10118-sp]|uniref:Uncharacterized protein n=1 Tax=Phanerochaete carnosa (strain HHB-10118-sp) TaxID=650164 RepID=K5VGC2_PHACS|nr:uncharacterized protein PHACADRAFT_201106 [Phanerochaete carnosa HHB-10118-sp]EKM50263.1 hypothetical protein PHACADRAFT_201106 [Phanerochaete carnosa HHB-10118-sp]